MLNTEPPISATIRNVETATSATRREEAYWDTILSATLHKQTTIKTPPSVQMKAWRDYEYSKFGVLGRRGAPQSLGYNLYTDSIRLVRRAYRLVDADWRTTRALTGFTPRTTPRRSLGCLAQAYGYRYLRGLGVIEFRLATGEELSKFRHERLEFRQALELSADAAHAINDKGQNPGAVPVQPIDSGRRWGTHL